MVKLTAMVNSRFLFLFVMVICSLNTNIGFIILTGRVAMHISSEMDTSPTSYKHQCFHSSCPDASNGASSTDVDLLSKAKNMGILEHSPGDEVEGELLYLQTKLLDNAVAVQRTCGTSWLFYLFQSLMFCSIIRSC